MSRPASGPRATACHHPNRKNWAHGYCSTCYQKFRRRENEDYRKQHSQKNWESRIKMKFGLTPEQYHDMVSSQSNLCKICGKPSGSRRLAIDHNWGTGKVRGLLCLQCNTHLGWYERCTKQIHTYLGDGNETSS